MNFKDYVRVQGSREAQLRTIFPDFPSGSGADLWDNLAVYTNTHSLPDGVITELEWLHDLFLLGEGDT